MHNNLEDSNDAKRCAHQRTGRFVFSGYFNGWGIWNKVSIVAYKNVSVYSIVGS